MEKCPILLTEIEVSKLIIYSKIQKHNLKDLKEIIILKIHLKKMGNLS